MLANSWLYHYYSVQSKIQFGLPYEGPAAAAARVPPTPTSYYHHHHHHHHHSPTIQTSLTHPYVSATAAHHMSYGYHSPVGIPPHQGSPGLIHNGTQIGHHSSGNAEHYRPYAYRLEPVDYSSQQQPLLIQSAEPRCGSANSSSSSSGRLGSPPSKRRAIARLEPLYIPENQEPVDVSPIEINSQHSQTSDGGGGVGGTILMTTVIPTRPTRYHSKAMPPDPADFMDQWNPSPPWSETAQKVPDIMAQELSPYLTTTPPTPTSAPPPSHGPAFSFDWMPEQFVPIMDSAPAPSAQCVPYLTQDGSITSLAMPVSMQLQMSHWPTDHRLLYTQSLDIRHTIDEDASIGECIIKVFINEF